MEEKKKQKNKVFFNFEQEHEKPAVRIETAISLMLCNLIYFLNWPQVKNLNLT